MSNRVTVKLHQTLLDLAIQENGSIENALQWAVSNDLSLTDDLVAGQSINSVEQTRNYTQNQVVSVFGARALKPATGFRKIDQSVFDALELADCGIDCMEIESTFLVR